MSSNAYSSRRATRRPTVLLPEPMNPTSTILSGRSGMRHGLLEQREEAWERDGNAGRALDLRRPRGAERSHRHRHRDPVVAVRAHARADERPSALDDEPVRQLAHVRPERSEPLAERRDPVALLDPQFPGAGDLEAAFGERGGDG